MSTRTITVKNTALAAAGSALLNLAIYRTGSATGVTWKADSPYPIGPPAVTLFSVAPLVGAAAVVGSVGRRNPGLRHLAAWSGLGFALATIAGSLSAAEETRTGLYLGAMHVVSGATWVVLSHPGRR